MRERDLEYLDPADSFLGLHHAYVLGRVPLRQQLSGAQVVSSKDNSINQVLWFAGSWDWARGSNRKLWLMGRHAVKDESNVQRSQHAVRRNRAKSVGQGKMMLMMMRVVCWVGPSSDGAAADERKEAQNWWEVWLRLICICDMQIWVLRHPLQDTACYCGSRPAKRMQRLKRCFMEACDVTHWEELTVDKAGEGRNLFCWLEKRDK